MVLKNFLKFFQIFYIYCHTFFILYTIIFCQQRLFRSIDTSYNTPDVLKEIKKEGAVTK